MKTALFLLVFFSSIASALANDAEFSNTSGGPAPIQNDDISMLSEDITMTRMGSGNWNVLSVYRFKNTTKKSVKLTIGFPEFLGDSEEKAFLKLETKVRGTRVPMTVKKTVPNAKKLFGDPLGRVHLFDVAFKPKETLEIHHRFEMGPSSSVAIADETFLSYVTKTGAFWKGPIGRATFTIKTRDVYELVAVPTTFKIKSVKRFVISKGRRSGMEIVLEMKDWTPTQDLDVTLFRDSDQMLQRKTIGECPRLEVRKWREYEKADRAGKAKLASVGDLSKYSTEQLRLCRNWVYARYGYPFKDKKLRKKMYRKPGLGTYPPIDLEEYPTSKQQLIYMNLDPGFSQSMLTIDDLIFVEKLKTEEKARKTR